MGPRPFVSCWAWPFVVGATLALSSGMTHADGLQKSEVGQNKKPSISLKANPPVGFSPLRVILTAELRGGSDDYQDFYCASVEWEWGDDTRSETKADCDPYEPGKSEIKRRFVQEHTFRNFTNSDIATSSQSGPVSVRVKFNLKQKNKVVGSGTTTIELRSGIGIQ